jgi:hypothetical protein
MTSRMSHCGLYSLKEYIIKVIGSVNKSTFDKLVSRSEPFKTKVEAIGYISQSDYLDYCKE